MFSRCHCPVITECSGLWINNKFLTKSLQCFRRHEKLPDLLLLNLGDLAFTPSSTLLDCSCICIYIIYSNLPDPLSFFSGGLMWCLGVCWRVKHIICDVTAGRCSSSLVLTTEETLNLWHCWGDIFFFFWSNPKQGSLPNSFLLFYLFFSLSFF